MKFIYKNPTNKWAIVVSSNLLDELGGYSIYRNYADSGWQPYKFLGNHIENSFMWLRDNAIISHDEMKNEISKLQKPLTDSK